MREYGPDTYGERIADRYDEWYASLDPGPAVERLAALADGGPVLELGIGTGRIALPLAARGVEVHGIDASPAMVARLREKPGGDAVPVTIGNFADLPVEGTFSVVFVAFNTFFALLTQEDQVRCFRNAARRLAPRGVFVIEAFVPDPSRFDRGQRISVERVEDDALRVAASRHDAARQRVDTHHLLLGEEGISLTPLRIRYAWPSELDLMARLAGLELRARWGGWAEQPFTCDSPAHVSVYGRGDAERR